MFWETKLLLYSGINTATFRFMGCILYGWNIELGWQFDIRNTAVVSMIGIYKNIQQVNCVQYLSYSKL